MILKNHLKKQDKICAINCFDNLLEAVKDDFTQLLRVNLNLGPFLMKERLQRIKKRE